MNPADFAKTIDRPSGADSCDVCGGRAVCDAPTSRGPWGYLCKPCFAAIGRRGIGFLFRDSADA
jgi:hypothetical protein